MKIIKNNSTLNKVSFSDPIYLNNQRELAQQASTTESIISNWLDVVRCGSNDASYSGSIFFLQNAVNSVSSGVSAWYVQPYNGYYRYVNFNANGYYNQGQGNLAN